MAVWTHHGACCPLVPAGVTVWQLGEVYRGPFSSNYWSSKGSYRHAYPVSVGVAANWGWIGQSCAADYRRPRP
jgi:hypothetical protein